jgi:geranyl-CoA carboxylase alpha subunit
VIKAVLIANRGEIACRIIHTCRRLGIRAVAVYSDADSEARHVRMADEAIHVGPAPAAASYLAIDAIVAAARRAEVDAVHPGFGFLAENDAFARACAAAGLIFIGPTAAAIEAMGNKVRAKAIMEGAGVPTIPGYSGPDQSDAALQEAVGRLGYPLLVKAAAGGGGKGMRVVSGPGQLPEALAAARREAGQAFGSGELLLERLLHEPRHVEFQIFGDRHGNLIHLGERECSIQRRFQKIIEETPSPALTPDLRRQMGLAAVAAGRAIGYENAGTVEFMLDGDGRFYFLEMNTRLQVEHAVTEAVTGIDLVEWQIQVAEGRPLPLRQEAVSWNGHAVEARLYAEDPANDFLPGTGKVLLWREPQGEGIRVDAGIQAGDLLSIHYDPMLAKIIAHGSDRITAIRRLAHALETTRFLGVTNNLAFLREVLDHADFRAGQLTTHFIDRHFTAWRPRPADVPLALVAATLVEWRRAQAAGHDGYWRNNPNRPQLFRYRPATGETAVAVWLTPVPRTKATYQLNLPAQLQETVTVTLNEHAEDEVALTVEGHRQHATVVNDGDTWWVQTRAGVVQLQALPLLPERLPPAGATGSLRAPMPGSVTAVLVEVGQRVSKGQPLLKLEAMKMEHTIRSDGEGVVTAVYFAAGEVVVADAQLLKIEPDTQ